MTRPGAPPSLNPVVRARRRFDRRKDFGSDAYQDQAQLLTLAAAALELREAAPESPAVLDAAAALAIAVGLGGQEARVTLSATTVAALLSMIWPDRA